MSTATEVIFEFRCTSCYQSLYDAIDAVGKTVVCPYCEKQVQIPEATEDRIRQAEDVDLAALRQPAEAGIFADRNLTPQEIAAESKRRAAAVTAAQTGYVSPATFSCSRVFRLLAFVADVGIVGAVFCANLFLGMILARQEVIGVVSPETFRDGVDGLALTQFLAYFGLVVGLTLVNWVLISVRGQSLGKMIFGIKIVDEHGFAPGFFQGVFLRQWVMGGISSIIPFVGIVNYLMIFRDPPRCWHDQIARTYVVDATKATLS